MNNPINVISSMAPKAMLSELVSSYELSAGVPVTLEAVGGVVVQRRLEAGEVFDVVVLSSEAMDGLIRDSRVVAGSKVELVSSGVAVAVRAGAPSPDLGSEEALRRAVLAASTIGCSTGPSGAKLRALFERWGVADQLRDRMVTAPPGVPVGELVARGDVALGFQQRSELIGVPGIEVLGPLPESVQIVTIFAAGIVQLSRQPDAARELIDFLASPSTADAKRRQGMDPADHTGQPVEVSTA